MKLDEKSGLMCRAHKMTYEQALEVVRRYADAVESHFESLHQRPPSFVQESDYRSLGEKFPSDSREFDQFQFKENQGFTGLRDFDVMKQLLHRYFKRELTEFSPELLDALIDETCAAPSRIQEAHMRIIENLDDSRGSIAELIEKIFEILKRVETTANSVANLNEIQRTYDPFPGITVHVTRNLIERFKQMRPGFTIQKLIECTRANIASRAQEEWPEPFL